MAKTECENCGHTYEWEWEEAFDKFGFNDGQGQIETWRVADALESAGYEVPQMDWGIHNTVIRSIRKDGIEQIPESVEIGYEDPHTYLPQEIVQLLDSLFPTDSNAGGTQ